MERFQSSNLPEIKSTPPRFNEKYPHPSPALIGNAISARFKSGLQESLAPLGIVSKNSLPPALLRLC